MVVRPTHSKLGETDLLSNRELRDQLAHDLARYELYKAEGHARRTNEYARRVADTMTELAARTFQHTRQPE